MWTGENVQGCDRARYAQIEIFIGNFRKIHVHRSKPWVVQAESLDKILIKLSESFFYRGHADPLPQALILTAIVIAFSVLAFAVVLIRRAYEVVGTDDLDKMKDTDT